MSGTLGVPLTLFLFALIPGGRFVQFAFKSARQWHDFIEGMLTNCLCAEHGVKRYSKELIGILSHGA